MTKSELENINNRLRNIHKELQTTFKDIEKVRKYYKYQNESTDSTSEDLIVSCNNVIGETYGCIDLLDELIAYEEEL